ncbi:MAG: hypothetical protein ACJ0Q6_07260 [Candidatus Azotimanducaceae bacterium]|uniref:Uncharacterized protein n=1 Tax=OM182 bacterium TaxID=2510334 RepID=A0A520S0D6_9GAMM|nr:hypothetical protein [Gammaproteobacteria bacterium]RZO75894.1 MAG: hypothetical protein EVA68_05815 [OM182 bacterium]
MGIQISHTSLAMKAARRMRTVKHKRKNSRVICHHLRKMLEGRESYLITGSNEPAESLSTFGSSGRKLETIAQSPVSTEQYSLMLSC